MTERKPKPIKPAIRIGAKDLGAINMPGFCPRCFWIKQKAKPMPFQIFPGIFSSIDAYTRKIIHASFDKNGRAPAWLPNFEHAITYLKVPHWSQFVRTDEKTGITISGVMDDLFEQVNGSVIIPDYKTAKFTKTQDALYPMYAAQLNAYAWIQEIMSPRPIGLLCLVYFEPKTKAPLKDTEFWPLPKYTKFGFDMEFTANTLVVERDPELVPDLLVKAKEILSLPEPPIATDGCKDCESLYRIKDMMGWI